MPLRKFALLASIVMLIVIALPGATLASSREAPEGDLASAFHGEGVAENDDLVPVALGTLGAVAAAAALAAIGYLYRRQIGDAARYDDGFTPRDPRDHPTH